MKLSSRSLLIPLLSLFAFFSAFSLHAEDELRLYGEIYSAITSKDLPGATVEILSQDSVVLASTVADYEVNYMQDGIRTVGRSSRYSISIPKKKGMYIVKVSFDGYDTVYRQLDLSKIGSRQTHFEVEKIYLRPSHKVTELDELEVKASKVKFYHKGDTIVYNADAFLLPEGSMLDALVKQLPGVEMREGGAIYVNGRYVESLLLNGKDFFKGNRQVMLENLGAYMVKNIEVYEKGGHISELMGKKVAGDTQYVMDVKLKKDYMAGNLINATVTGGTEDRFLGKLFGLHYTNNSRIAAYVNANNLNDTDKPNDGNSWSVQSDGRAGLTDTYRGGIDYMVDNPKHTWELNGNADVSYNKNVNNTDKYTTNFLPGGNTFDYSFARPVYKNLGVSTTHNWRLRREKWDFTLTPTFTYNSSKNHSETTAASFSKEIQDITPDFIKNLTKNLSVDPIDGVINRNIVKSSSHSHGVQGDLYSEFTHKVNASNDFANVFLNLNLKDGRSNRYNDQSILFGGNPFTATLLNQHFKELPDKSFSLKTGARYYLNLPKGALTFKYEYNHKNERKNSDLFLLEARKADGSIPEDFEGMTPVFDAANSYDSRLTTNSHMINPFIYQNLTLSNGVSIYLTTSPEFYFYNRRLDYHRGMMDVYPKKNDFTLRITNTSASIMSANYRKQMVLRYLRTPSLASLVDMVDYRDTSDPLNIQEGNPGLKNSYYNDLALTLNTMPEGKWIHALSMSFRWTDNDLTRGYRYDSQTGVRTFKTYNVNGNNSFLAVYATDGSLPGKMKKFQASSQTYFTRSQYANMIGEDRDPQKQKVLNSEVKEVFSLTYSHTDLRISAKGSFAYRHTSSEADMFPSFNAFDFNYGLEGYYRLPFGLSFDTSLIMYSRRGYTQSVMNDNRLIWNASIRYTMLKGALGFRLTGHDMLGQIKNVNYDINARGLTETRITTLPRYFSLSVEYKFDFRPKREKQSAAHQ